MSSRSKPLKICLIVDNPTRDLDGLVLLARELAKLNFDVFLVPMYSAGYEVPAICPDFVLFNYARKANAALIKSFHRAGIAVGILDTEGGIWESPSQFVKSVAHAELSDFIDQYYFWGPQQKKAFENETRLAPEKLHVTGCPRYDFCVEPWSKAIPIANTVEAFILIISNFALSNPRFVSPQTEANNMVAAGYDRNYVESRIVDETKARNSLIEVIKNASDQFPEKYFIIRTHPFESDSDYKNIFSGRKNVRIVRELTVASWLKPAALVLHLNSSVGVDAALMNKPVFTLDWISSNVTRGTSPLPLLVSQPLNSEAELFAVIRQGAKTHDWSPRRQALMDWFYLMDGRAHTRVATEISRFLNVRKQNPNRALCRQMFFYGSRNKSNLIGYFDSIGRLTLGAATFKWLRNNIFTKNIFHGTKSDKFFSVSQINEILQKLAAIESSTVQALSVSEAETDFARGLSESVYLNMMDMKVRARNAFDS